MRSLVVVQGVSTLALGGEIIVDVFGDSASAPRCTLIALRLVLCLALPPSGLYYYYNVGICLLPACLPAFFVCMACSFGLSVFLSIKMSVDCLHQLVSDSCQGNLPLSDV